MENFEFTTDKADELAECATALLKDHGRPGLKATYVNITGINLKFLSYVSTAESDGTTTKMPIALSVPMMVRMAEEWLTTEGTRPHERAPSSDGTVKIAWLVSRTAKLRGEIMTVRPVWVVFGK